MGNTAEVVIRLSQTGQRQVVTALGGVTRGLGDLKSQVFNLRNLLAGLGIGLLVRDLTRANAEQRRAVMGLETAMRSMGRYTPELSGKLQDLASSLQDVTNYDAEATLEGTKFLITYRDIADELLPRSMAAMQDLAALMGGDVTAAANMLGKASMGMTGELRRVGITVDDATFKSRGYVGVLSEIESQVRGQARAMREASGPWIALGNAIGDVKEEAGGIVNTVFAPVGDELIAWVGGIRQAVADFKASTEFEGWADKTADTIIGGMERALIGTAGLVDEFGPVVSNLWNSVEHMWSGFRALPPWVQEVGIIGALIGGTKGKALLALTAMSAGIIERQARAAEAYGNGLISLSEWARADDQELEALLAGRQKKIDTLSIPGVGGRQMQPWEGFGVMPADNGRMIPSHGDAAAALLGAGPAEDSAVDYVTRFLEAARAKADEIRAARQVESSGSGPAGGAGEQPTDQSIIDARFELRMKLMEMQNEQREFDENMIMERLQREKDAADERVRLEAQAQQAMQGLRQAAAVNAVNVLRLLAGENKAFAVAALAVQTMLALQSAYKSTAAAATLAFASQLVPGDPSSLGRAAAASAAAWKMGLFNMALIGAGAAIQGVQSINGDQPVGYGGGTPNSPIVTTPGNVPAVQQQNQTAPGKTFNVNLYGYINAEDKDSLARDLIDALRKADDDGY